MVLAFRRSSPLTKACSAIPFRGSSGVVPEAAGPASDSDSDADLACVEEPACCPEAGGIETGCTDCPFPTRLTTDQSSSSHLHRLTLFVLPPGSPFLGSGRYMVLSDGRPKPLGGVDGLRYASHQDGRSWGNRAEVQSRPIHHLWFSCSSNRKYKGSDVGRAGLCKSSACTSGINSPPEVDRSSKADSSIA
jgi:hypothetical protein